MVTLWLLLTIPITWAALYVTDLAERAWKHRAAMRSEWAHIYRFQQAMLALGKSVRPPR